jgi:hypothetical protein
MPVISENIMIPSEILDYVDFKTGTYWIVQDSASGEIDSTVVIGSKHIMEGIADYNECNEEIYYTKYENIVISMVKYNINGTYIDSWDFTFANEPKMHGNSLKDEFEITYGGVFKIAYPFNRVYHFGGYTITEAKIDSIVTPAGIYEQIVNVNGVLDTPPNSEQYVSSWAKGIGSVQSVYYSHSVRKFKSDLIRFKIM